MLANRTNSIVVAVEYRRPPEHPYPAALDDSFFVLDWIRDNKSSLSTHPGLYLIGDSAGGQLVPAVCIKNLARENAVEIHGQVLVNPVMDMRSSSLAYKNYPFFVKPYITDESLLTDPLVSPILYDDLTTMPPTQVIVSENDFLKAEGMAYHEKITASGQYTSLFESIDIGHLGPVWAAGHEAAMPALNAVVEQLLAWYEQK